MKMLRLGMLILLLVVLCMGYWLNPNFKVTTYTVTTDKSITDLRIVFVSDLHLKEYGENNEKLLNKIKELNPSLIAIGGDSVIYNIDEFEPAITFINGAADIAPIYFALGNHEWSEIYTSKNTELLEALQASKAEYLENELIEVNIDGNELVICGIIDSVYAEHNFANDIITEFNSDKYNDKFKLLLSHRPVTIAYTDVTPVSDLVLSGHEHGGQVIIPFTKQGLYSRNQGWFPKYTSGIHTIANNTVVISTGLSNSDLVVPRVNNRPELVVIDVN